jgi:hypothetical protein
MKYDNDDGDKFVYRGIDLHREDGPAVEHANGRKEYWLDGKKYSNEYTWRKELERRKNADETEDDEPISWSGIH